MLSGLEDKSVEKLQREWTQSTKGKTTREIFPEVTERLKLKINFTQNFTTMVTGHGKTMSYLHHSKIIEASTCPCGARDQTTDHLLFESEHLNKGRDILNLSVLKINDWPTNKRDLIGKYVKEFIKCINKIQGAAEKPEGFRNEITQ